MHQSPHSRFRCYWIWGIGLKAYYWKSLNDGQLMIWTNIHAYINESVNGRNESVIYRDRLFIWIIDKYDTVNVKKFYPSVQGCHMSQIVLDLSLNLFLNESKQHIWLQSAIQTKKVWRLFRYRIRPLIVKFSIVLKRLVIQYFITVRLFYLRQSIIPKILLFQGQKNPT